MHCRVEVAQILVVNLLLVLKPVSCTTKVSILQQVVIILSRLSRSVRVTTPFLIVTALAVVAATRAVPRSAPIAVRVAILLIGTSLLSALATLILAHVPSDLKILLVAELLDVALHFVFDHPARDEAITLGEKAARSEV